MMAGVMDDPVAFLRARYDEDERVARDVRPDQDYRDSEHQDRWSPGRVLVEVEANRRTLDEHQPIHGYDPNGPVCATCGEPGQPGEEDAVVRWPCKTIRLRLLPYADHPDYNPAWRP